MTIQNNNMNQYVTQPNDSQNSNTHKNKRKQNDPLENGFQKHNTHQNSIQYNTKQNNTQHILVSWFVYGSDFTMEQGIFV